jgi:hypothetical protein
MNALKDQFSRYKWFLEEKEISQENDVEKTFFELEES